MANRIKFATIILLFLIFACTKKDDQTGQQTKNDTAGNNMHQVVAEEVLHASNYTYIKVKEGAKSYWITVNHRETEIGEKLYFTGGLLMKDFKSKPLKRTFSEVLFLQKISNDPFELAAKSRPEPVAIKAPEVSTPVETIEGETSLA